MTTTSTPARRQTLGNGYFVERSMDGTQCIWRTVDGGMSAIAIAEFGKECPVKMVEEFVSAMTQYATPSPSAPVRSAEDLNAPEPVGPKGCNKLSIKGAQQHNRRQVNKMIEGRLYRLYDHYRSAFWGPNRAGYQYRVGAGLYTPEEAKRVILGDDQHQQERYFTVEEVRLEAAPVVPGALREALDIPLKQLRALKASAKKLVESGDASSSYLEGIDDCLDIIEHETALASPSSSGEVPFNLEQAQYDIGLALEHSGYVADSRAVPEHKLKRIVDAVAVYHKKAAALSYTDNNTGAKGNG